MSAHENKVDSVSLSDLGTTGLVSYVADHGAGRRYSLALGRAMRVLRKRGAGPAALMRFRQACAREQYRREHGEVANVTLDVEVSRG